MGLGDTTSQILLRFKADTKDARREIKKLSGDQKKAAEEALEAQERQNRSLEGQIETIGKVALAVGAAVGAYKALTESAKAYADRQRLVAASAGADIASIQGATKGLITETQSLQFAAAALNTDFALSQKEMEEVAKFMIVLRNQGNDLGDVYNEVTKAIVETNTEGLKKFGIQVKASSGTLEAHEAIMQRIREENVKAGDSILRAGDDALIASNKFQDAFASLTDSMGRFANSPIVTTAIGIITATVEGFNIITGNRSQLTAAQTIAELQERRGRFAPSADAGSRSAQRVVAEIDQEIATIREALATEQALLRDQQRLRHTLFQEAIGAARIVGDVAGSSALERFAQRFPTGTKPGSSGGARSDITFATEIAGTSAGFGVQTGGPIGSLGLPAGVTADQAEGLGFGSITAMLRQGELLQESLAEAKLAEQLNTLSNAATTFGSAGAQAFSMWLSGAESMGDALKKVTGQTLAGLSAEMFGKGLFHAASAIGSLALGRLEAAGLHGASAAEYFAGAAATGVMARAFGVGAQNGNRGGGGGALPAAASAAQSSPQPQPVTQQFIVQHSFFDDNPHEAQRRMRRAMDRARESGSTSNAVRRE